MPDTITAQAMTIEIRFSSREHLNQAALIFDAWKSSQNKSGWLLSGWAIHTFFTAKLFVVSKAALSPEAIKELTERLNRVCLNTTVTQLEIKKNKN